MAAATARWIRFCMGEVLWLSVVGDGEADRTKPSSRAGNEGILHRRSGKSKDNMRHGNPALDIPPCAGRGVSVEFPAMNETSSPGPVDRRLDDVLHGREDNFLLPLFWMKGDDRARLPERVAQVRESGCRALCVESRPHPDFCGPGWWADLDVVLAEAERLGMRVWILDDRHFPTGEANGALARHP